MHELYDLSQNRQRRHSEETRKKIATSNTGKQFSAERKKAISDANKKKLSPDVIERARSILLEKCCSFDAAMRHIGIKPTRALRSALEAEGVTCCPELKFFNREIDYETGKRLLSYLKLNLHWIEIHERTGLTQKEITGARCKLESIHDFVYRPERKSCRLLPTKIELLVKEFLSSRQIEFVQEYNFGNFYFDFWIKNTSLLIEVNGDYWHANPCVYPDTNLLNETQKKMVRRDNYKRKFAKEHGFFVLYVWETDIKNSPEKVASLLERYIENAYRKADNSEFL